jgi:hypothetical protein
MLVDGTRQIVVPARMSTSGWDFTLVSPALTLDGQTSQILARRIQLDGRDVIVLRAGHDGSVVVLLPSAAGELVANIQMLTGGGPC